jgi:uncharacterized integral membrane protein
LLRKTVAAIVLVPLAIIIIAFAVANRQPVTISFDPFAGARPAFAMTTWLFVPIFIALIAGVLIGGVSSWLRQGKSRDAARRLDREMAVLRGKIAALEGGSAARTSGAGEASPPRLMLRTPVR